MKANVRGILAIFALAIVGLIAAIQISATAFAQDVSSSAPQGGTDNRTSGTIADIINVPGYTYAEVETAAGMVWVAATSVSVQVGDSVSFTTGMPMQKFYSSSLEREFEEIYFVDRFESSDGVTSIPREASAAHGRAGGQATVTPVHGIRKAEDGYTIAEIFAQADALRGETIRVRGQVVKFTPGVLNANWIRIQDGSNAEELVITTDGNVAVNDILLIEGELEFGKNLGQGYVIAAIIENAKISIE